MQQESANPSESSCMGSAYTHPQVHKERAQSQPEDTQRWRAKGLAANSVTLLGIVVMGAGTAGPAYSLAASLGILASASGFKAPAVLILSFIPMLMAASAFYSFARVDPDCGQAFWWTTRALGPFVGWIQGFWGIAMVLLIGPNIANVAAAYFYLLLGLQGPAASNLWLTLGSTVVLTAVTALVALGIRPSLRTQYVLMSLQMAGLLAFASATLVKPFFAKPAHYAPLSIRWFTPEGISLSALMDGMLIGVFLYTGWDVAASLAEESREPRRLPAIGTVLSAVVLVLVFVLCAAGAQSYHGPQFLAGNIDAALAAVSADALGRPWDRIVLLSVFAATTSVTFSMMVYVARWTLSMASAGALPSVFGRVDPARRTPLQGTLILGGTVAGIRIILACLNKDLVTDLVPSLALLSALEYAVAAFACVLYFRKQLTSSVRNFFLMGAFPALGGLILMGVYAGSLIRYWNPANSLSGGWLGVGSIFWLGSGAALLGVALLPAARFWYPEFFKRRPAFFPR